MKKTIIIILILLIVGLCAAAFIKNMSVRDAYDDTPSSGATSTDNMGQEGIVGSWKWVNSVDAAGRFVTPTDSSKFVITFTAEGRLSSTTDCNNLAGSYIRNEEVISVGPIVSTKMACEGDTYEAVYAGQLAMASSHVIEGDTLRIILVKDAGVMTFVRN